MDSATIVLQTEKEEFAGNYTITVSAAVSKTVEASFAFNLTMIRPGEILDRLNELENE